MKSFQLIGILLLAGSSVCWAAEVEISTSAAASQSQSGPCHQIVEICQNARYSQDGHATGSRGLYEDCVQPMMSGRTVADIAVSPSYIDACRATLAKHQEKATPEETLASESKTVISPNPKN